MNEYQKRVLDSRKQFLKLNLHQEEELLSIYEEAAKQISYKLSKINTDTLTARHLSELKKSINQYRNDLMVKLPELIKNGVKSSVDIAIGTQLSFFDKMGSIQDIKPTFSKMFAQINDKVVEKMITGNYYADGKTLDQRLWNITTKNAKDIDRLIKTNVAKGTNAKNLAKELDNYINPNNRLKCKSKADGISNNISYQAKRLSRTSLTHANSEAYIEGSKANPFCKGLRWNLSASHSSRGGNDICDQYASKVFKADEIPLQHCNCLCYFTQEVMDIDKSRKELIDWVNGESNEKLDNWMDEYGEEFGIDIGKDKSKVDDKLVNSKDKKDDIIKSETKNVLTGNKFNSNAEWDKQLNISHENSNKLNEIHTSLNEFMNVNRKEKLVLLDIQNNKIIKELEGDKSNEVKLNKETRKLLKDSKENTVIFTHNHPSKTTFSKNDINQIMVYKSIKSLTLECSDGTKYILDRANLKYSILKEYSFFSNYQKIYNNVSEKYPELGDEIKVYEVWDDFLNEVTREVANKYGMIYRKVENVK